MQKAHERVGTLEFTKRMKDTTTRVRVYIDPVVVESAQIEQGQASAHLISMIGGDSEIGAMWAAVTEAALLHIDLPGRGDLAASLGPEARYFRGSLAVPGRKRPGRRLVAASAELVKTKPGGSGLHHVRENNCSHSSQLSEKNMPGRWRKIRLTPA
jgi:hypothetical protein